MAEVTPGVPRQDLSRDVARAAWGVLLIWTGAVLLLHWGWGVGLVGAGAILIGAQAFRRSRQLKVDGFGLVAGALLVICGVASLLELAIDLVPVLCILAGVALLASIWTARAHHPAGADADLHAPPQPKA